MYLAVFASFIKRKTNKRTKIRLTYKLVTQQQKRQILYFAFAFKQIASRGPDSSYLIYVHNLNLLLLSLVNTLGICVVHGEKQMSSINRDIYHPLEVLATLYLYFNEKRIKSLGIPYSYMDQENKWIFSEVSGVIVTCPPQCIKCKWYPGRSKYLPIPVYCS